MHSYYDTIDNIPCAVHHIPVTRLLYNSYPLQLFSHPLTPAPLATITLPRSFLNLLGLSSNTLVRQMCDHVLLSTADGATAAK